MSALKYLGIFILLIGVVVLIIPTLTGKPSNMYLLVGLLLIIGGLLGHIFFNKKFE